MRNNFNIFCIIQVGASKIGSRKQMWSLRNRRRILINFQFLLPDLQIARETLQCLRALCRLRPTHTWPPGGAVHTQLCCLFWAINTNKVRPQRKFWPAKQVDPEESNSVSGRKVSTGQLSMSKIWPGHERIHSYMRFMFCKHFPVGSGVKNPPANAGATGDEVAKISCRRKRQPAPVTVPEKSGGL